MNGLILLTGGAGYIGSHTAHALQQAGYQVLILDAFVHRQAYGKPSLATVIKGNLGNRTLLDNIFQRYPITAVMHFAGLIEVGESVKHPDAFYRNNVVYTLGLLDVMRAHGVKKFIFSSTCALYGNPHYMLMDEKHPLLPQSPYGNTKLAVELALQDYARAYDLAYVALRYFNAAGALPDHGLGECHQPETHVIPLLLRAAAQRAPFTVHGTDYDTPDGTCVRDYIHVYDIARAHLLALQYLESGQPSDVFNLGTGSGFSVRQLIDKAQEVCGIPIVVQEKDRRPGDVATLIADARKAATILHWQPEHSALDTILKSAWRWEMRMAKYHNDVKQEKFAA